MLPFVDGFDLAVAEDHNGINTGVMVFNCARNNGKLVAFLEHVWDQRHRPAPPGKDRQYEQNAIQDLLPASGLQVRCTPINGYTYRRTPRDRATATKARLRFEFI